MKILNCYNNELTSLPNLPNSLTELYCSKIDISELDLTKNTKLTKLDAKPNKNLNYYTGLFKCKIVYFFYSIFSMRK